MKTWVTSYDRELLEHAGALLAGLEQSSNARAVLERFGLDQAERERGRQLHEDTARAFEWEERGVAWSFLSPTPERRTAEAKHWYRDTRERHLRECLRLAEEESGWIGHRAASRWPLQRKLLEGSRIAARHLLHVFSLRAFLEHRAELRENLRRAQGEPPAGAPPPKDTALVQLSGWYERWRLLAQRVFRKTPEELTALGLVPGKAPPRLRAPSARKEFGESAGATILARPAAAASSEPSVD
jgi:hypothetical protein